MVIVAGPAGPKWVIFWCPCGHGHRIELDVHPSHRPSWRVAGDSRQRPTIVPSIDARGGRRCHFWVRGGRVQWVADV